MQFQIQTDIQNIKKSALQNCSPWGKEYPAGHLPLVAKIDNQYFWLNESDKKDGQFLIIEGDIKTLIAYLISHFEWAKYLAPQDLFRFQAILDEFDVEWHYLHGQLGDSLQLMLNKWGFLLDIPQNFKTLLLNKYAEPALFMFMQVNGFKWEPCFVEILSNFKLSSSQQRDFIELLGRYLRRTGTDSDTFLMSNSEELRLMKGDRSKLFAWLTELSNPRLVKARSEREKQIREIKILSGAKNIEWDHSLECSQLKFYWTVKSIKDWHNLSQGVQSDELKKNLIELLED